MCENIAVDDLFEHSIIILFSVLQLILVFMIRKSFTGDLKMKYSRAVTVSYYIDIGSKPRRVQIASNRLTTILNADKE